MAARLPWSQIIRHRKKGIVILPPMSPNSWMRHELIDRLLDALTISSVLEVGAGQGAMAVRLAKRFEYLGVEPDPTSCRVAKDRLERLGRGRVHLGDITAIEDTSKFDLLCAFEVLEHIADDAKELERWTHHVRDGGWILLSVPAFEARFGPSDRKVGHYRRYEREDLHDLLRSLRLRPEQVWTYGFPLGYILEWVRNRLANRSDRPISPAHGTAASGRWLQPGSWIGWLTWFTTVPFRLLQIPFRNTNLGTGFVVLAHKEQPKS